MSLPDGGKSFDDMCIHYIHLEDTIPPECDVQMDGFAIAISRCECLRVIKSKSCVWVCTCFSKWTANHCYSDLKRLLLPPRLLNGPQLAGLLQHVHAVALDRRLWNNTWFCHARKGQQNISTQMCSKITSGYWRAFASTQRSCLNSSSSQQQQHTKCTNPGKRDCFLASQSDSR